VSKVSEKPAKVRGRTTLSQRLDKKLEKREKLAAKIARANARYTERDAKNKARREKDLGRAPQKLVVLDAELAADLRRHRYWFVRLYSKTITRASGVIKYVTRPRELELPENAEALIQDILDYRGGEQYLIKTYTLDRKKILNAPPGLWAIVQRHGGWRGRHRTISVTSPSAKVKQISYERFNDRQS